MAGPPKSRQTAAELQAQLESDPEWVAQKEARERVWRERHEQLKIAERPIVDGLSRLGIGVDSVWDLVNIEGDYQSAIPILFSHLLKSYPDRIKEGLARSLAVPSARHLWSELVPLYKETDAHAEPGFKEGLSVALAALAEHKELDDIIDLLSASQHGDSRLHLLRPLFRSKTEKAFNALDQLALDPFYEREIRRRRRTAKR